jgi:phosphoribosylformylglycinamidine synthase
MKENADQNLLRFYRKAGSALERCFYVETSAPFSPEELEILHWLLSETFEPSCFGRSSQLQPGKGSIIEVGPRLNFATAFSTNAVGICHACGLTKVIRLEQSRRMVLPIGTDPADHYDRMTQFLYPQPLETFATGMVPDSVHIVPLIEEGIEALRRINLSMGLGMDKWDLEFYFDLFVNVIGRNPTNVECFQLGQANSEHSRHWFFRGKMVRSGQELPETLFQIVQSTLTANPGNSEIAFADNSSAIRGFTVETLVPEIPGQCSPLSTQQCTYHITFTAETHNHPSGVAPLPGAETGTGGRIRDGHAVGQGGLVVAGTAGYCTGNLNIPGYPIPGEDASLVYPGNLAPPLRIIIEMSNGASDYGNKFGEPVIQGFTRTFDLKIPEGRRGWAKPIMFTGGVGQMDARHTKKAEPEPGMVIVQIGGPAYRIGVGGGSASSMIAGENAAELDWNSVQRGDAEMKNKVDRAIRACVEMGDNNPILSIHDQGAGGPCNVLTEIVEPVGGRIEIREIRLGDATMSVLEIWSAEYQERDALLIDPDRLDEFLTICQREKVHCELVGKVTGDGRIVVHDSQDDSQPVNLDLSQILCDMPQKEFAIDPVPGILSPLELPAGLTVKEAVQMVFQLPAVGSKGFLTRKVDRGVTGLVAQQQCCGPLQLPVADVAVTAQSHFGVTGSAIAIGEQPIKMLVDSEAGARMAVGEMLTNMMFALITRMEDIKCSANWMWAAKLAGEGSKLYDAAIAMRDLMIKLGVAVDGGKDSLSMAAMIGDETVKAPGELVISGYAPVPDIRKVVTPDIKLPTHTALTLLDIAPGKFRLGGSALAQAHGQIGDESPDVDDPELLKNAFMAVQVLISRGLILSGHDVSDGGLITTIAEMIMPSNCGAIIRLPKGVSLLKQLFSEELGIVIEHFPGDELQIKEVLRHYGVPCRLLGSTHAEIQRLIVSNDGEETLDVDLPTLLQWWEATSDQLELLQMNQDLARQQTTMHNRPGPSYSLSFQPRQTLPSLLTRPDKPKVAIIREEGSNGDREMASAFHLAGFTSIDVPMTDLLNGDFSLDTCRGVVFVGGFSYADVLGSAKGWAGIIRFNPELQAMFERFRQRPDTFSLGVCNGCQLSTLLGWVPWEGIPGEEQPRFTRNASERFESRWATVQILESPSIMLQGMEGSTLGIWVAHGEGRLHCPNPAVLEDAVAKRLAPVVFVDDSGKATEQYPLNPNGSPSGITALCSEDGRHLAMMPHPERAFLTWQWAWMSWQWRTELAASPWLQMFQNARKWCEQT